MPRTSASAGVSRRTVLRATALGALATAAGVDDVFGQARQAPPNIVFIMADDLGYADVSCYGRPDFKTPNIDRIAAQGVRFLQGYANSAVCSATRTALITGRYQYRLRVGLEEPLGRQQRRRPAARASDAAVAAQESRLRHDARRQVAPRRAARLRPAQERLRPLLRLPRRRPRLLPPHARRPQRRSVGRRRAGAPDGVPDGAVRRPRRRCHQRLREVASAVLPEPPLQRAALAVGSAGRRGRIGAPPRRGARPRDYDGGSQKTYQRDDRGDGRADRPRAQGARRQPSDQQHHRHLHERQRRRALRRHVAVHRPKDRAARRRPADSVDHLVARADSAGEDERSGVDLDGLDADAAGGGRRVARSGASAGRHQPAAAS